MNTKFNLIDAIQKLSEKQQLTGYESDVSEAVRADMRGIPNVGAMGQLTLPARRAINVSTATQGKEIVGEDVPFILPPLENSLVLVQAGARFVTGHRGNVVLPSFSGITAAWKGETAAGDESSATFKSAEFVPKRLTTYVDISRAFLKLAPPEASQILATALIGAVAAKLEATILGKAAGSATQPQGMGYKITSGIDTRGAAVVPDWEDIVGLELAVGELNSLRDRGGYITNAAGRRILKSVQKSAYTDPSLDIAVGVTLSLMEEGMMNGYPVFVTNSASNDAGYGTTGNLLVFGDWSQLGICQWGGYDVTVDPYSIAKDGQVRLVINSYFDAKGLRGSKPTHVSGTPTSVPDEYATSFSSIAITI